MNIHSGNCLAHRLRTAATSKTFRNIRKLTESIRNDISLINYIKIPGKLLLILLIKTLIKALCFGGCK